MRDSHEPPQRAAPELPDGELGAIARSLRAIESCLQLVSDGDEALRHRVALDLIRSEAHSASVLVHCLGLLRSHDAQITRADEPIELLVREVIDGFDAERRFCGAAITMDRRDHYHVAAVDRECFGTGVAGAIGALLAIVQSSRTPAIHVRVSPPSPQAPLTIELAQQSTGVHAATLARFFDVQWTERPGGYHAAVYLAAARRSMELHGGAVEVQTSVRGGCRIVMTLPPAGLPG
jgi:hypothetical protein